jgi:nucleoid-associated protein YgaU
MHGIRHLVFGTFLLIGFFVVQAQEATAADLQTQLTAALDTIDKLEARLSSEQTALSNLKVKLVQEVAAREAKIAELSAAPTPAATSNGAQERLNRSLVRNAQLSATIRGLEKSMATLSAESIPITQCRAQSKSLNALITSLSSQNSVLRATQTATPEPVAAPAANTGQLKSLNTLITSLSNQNAQLRASARAAANQVAAAPVATVTPASNAGQLKSLNTLITSLSNQNAQLRASARTAAATVAAPSSNLGQLKSLNTLITSLSNQNSGLRAQLRNLQNTQVAAPATSTQGYVIKAGDTLSSIALARYGDAERWGDIAQANGISDGETFNLEIGQIINLP